ncbi:MAG: amino acid-binding protein [Desulfatitalea sp. BRH_c12]|nr:MAG: amino acid-binding protein [Desulfatitalea sp. BRH_c12]
MVRTEISLFLKNAPGELGKLTALFAQAGINIDAITIQDASNYVRELFKGRGKSLKRIASAASYDSMSKDSADFALIRLLPCNGMINQAIDLLSQHEYLFDILPVIAIAFANRPGELAKVAGRLGREGINIHYVYGSAPDPDQRCLLVFCPDDIDRAARIFKDPEVAGTVTQDPGHKS